MSALLHPFASHWILTCFFILAAASGSVFLYTVELFAGRAIEDGQCKEEVTLAQFAILWSILGLLFIGLAAGAAVSFFGSFLAAVIVLLLMRLSKRYVENRRARSIIRQLRHS